MAGKRYLTITLFSRKDCYNLGMIPVKDSANAKNIKMLIFKKIASFGLTLEEHIISVICYGAAVSIRFSKDNNVLCQLCLNHGIHLAVTDILYNKKPKSSTNVAGGIDMADTVNLIFSSEEMTSDQQIRETVEDDIDIEDHAADSDDVIVNSNEVESL